MARGNDALEAQKELEGRLGSELNAEALIDANKRRYPAEARAANAKKVDHAATEALDQKAVAAAVKKDYDGTLVDDDAAYVVRGEFVVALYENAAGRVEKCYIPVDEIGKSRAKGKKAKAEEED